MLVFVAVVPSAGAQGRSDWRDYAWQKIDIAKCSPSMGQLICPPFHEKWDWKRRQWVDIAIAINPATDRVYLTQQLTNDDPHDDDDVCVTVIVVDRAGNNVLVHHQNWKARHGAVQQKEFSYRSGRLADAATIHLGSKQCRKGAHQDDAVYAAVTARLSP